MTQRHATVNAEDGVTNVVLLFTVACISWQTLTWLQVVSSPIKPSILGASAKFRKATINFVMLVLSFYPSMCLSVRIEQLCSNWTDCNANSSRENSQLADPHLAAICKFAHKTKYRVIHKSFRDFRTRLRNNQDRHGRKEHINR